ncbi:MAG: hypothetical protein ACLQOO_36065 [Terriglobia bacterium]
MDSIGSSGIKTLRTISSDFTRATKFLVPMVLVPTLEPHIGWYMIAKCVK